MLKLFSSNENKTRNIVHQTPIASNETVCSFNEHEIEYFSTPIPDSILDLKQRHNKLLNYRDPKYSPDGPIASRLRPRKKKP